MNFATMLAAAVPPPKKKKRSYVKTPEEVEKWKATRKARTIERYRKVFEHFGGRANTSQIATYTGYNQSQLGVMLKTLPQVVKVDEVRGTGSRKVFVWEWRE